MSDLSLWVTWENKSEQEREREMERLATHASSNDLIAFLMPSAPSASAPYGSLDEPEML